MKYEVLYGGHKRTIDVSYFKETVDGFISFYRRSYKPGQTIAETVVLMIPKDSLVYVELVEGSVDAEPSGTTAR